MSIHWSRAMLETLLPPALLARIPEAQVDPSFDSSKAEGYTVPFYNGKTGDHIVELPMKNCVRVSRRKMRSLCSEGVDVKVRLCICLLLSALSTRSAPHADLACLSILGRRETGEHLAVRLRRHSNL